MSRRMPLCGTGCTCGQFANLPWRGRQRMRLTICRSDRPGASDMRSAEQLADGLARAQLDGPAGGGGDVFLGRIEAQGREHRRVHVFDLGRLDGIFDAFGVGLAQRPCRRGSSRRRARG